MDLINWDHKRRIKALQDKYTDVSAEDVRRDYKTATRTCIHLFAECRAGAVTENYARDILDAVDASIENRINRFFGIDPS